MLCVLASLAIFLSLANLLFMGRLFIRAFKSQSMPPRTSSPVPCVVGKIGCRLDFYSRSGLSSLYNVQMFR